MSSKKASGHYDLAWSESNIIINSFEFAHGCCTGIRGNKLVCYIIRMCYHFQEIKKYLQLVESHCDEIIFVKN